MTKKYKEPLVFNAYKPPHITSYDVIRHFKRNLPKGYGKIGHFGTLDPFASGVLPIGVNGAARLNDFIHNFLPKTYIAYGKLGVETETGDLTVEPSQIDDSIYLTTEIASFSKEFIQNFLQEKFLGQYFQSPHKYSAAKFEGKALHKWAREGVEIKKEKKERFIYKIEVVEYEFPSLIIRYEVSSGTYIRSLFSECANALGTIGTLASLVREKIGICDLENNITQDLWPTGEDWDFDKYGIPVDKILPLGNIIFAEKEANLYKNGVSLKTDRAESMEESSLSQEFFWVRNEKFEILGLAKIENEFIKTQFNFSSNC